MNKIIFPLKAEMRGEGVVDLQEGLRVLLEKGLFPFDDGERQTFQKNLGVERSENIYGPVTQKLVAVFQDQHQLAGSGEVDERTAQALNAMLAELAPAAPATYEVQGHVASRLSAGVSGLRVEIVDKTVGDDDLRLTQAFTGDDGAYHAIFTEVDLRPHGKDRPDLQVRVYVGDTLLAASDVRYNASNRETLHVRLDEKAVSSLQSEHETLTGTVFKYYKGRLGDLQETVQRQDITYLANKTGWDARAVALAALADQFSARASDGGGAGIEPAYFYALFRAGLPANEAAIYQTDAKSVEAIWKQAITQGVIPGGLENSLSAAVNQFRKLAAQWVLDGPALFGVSPLKEIVSVSLGDDLERQSQFAKLYAEHRDDLPAFWTAVRGAFGDLADRIKLDGQLAYLTLNNAPLIRDLHERGGANGITNTLNLAQEGYHRAEKWQELIGNNAIPPEIPGENESEKRKRYAELLAAQVRLSFPTAVVAQMVTSGETPLAADTMRNDVHAFLTEHLGKFEIGVHPIEQYATQHNLQIEPEVTKEITRIQRVYQITPGNDAMNGLLKKGVDSAFKVIRYDRDPFVELFKNEVGGEANARLIYAKSQQVHNAVLNITVSYLTASHAPGIGVHSPPQIVNPTPIGPNPNASDVIAYATLESLLGEMDYCDCEHCRSILSPAAYLVDLLLFLDQPVPNTAITPLEVLLSRRPNLQHLLLNCENTNTPLPYIDLVNETLEYYVTHNLSLEHDTGHDTDGDATTEELLANPQFVSDKAYELLAGRPAQPAGPAPVLPPTASLPFHQPLETLRRYFDRFEAPLPAVMEALRQNEEEHGWRDILMEELRLSREEYGLLTDRNKTLQQLYGYPPTTSETDVLAALSKVKTFTRRVGISNEDIIEILKTRFINPNSTLIPKLERLGVPFATLKKFKEGTITDAQFEQVLAPDLDASQYGGDIKAWVKNEENYANIMGLITLTDLTDENGACSFDKLEFRYANPNNDANKVRAFAFVRLIRFIRLWKKLGWSIEQTDQAITALYPTDPNPNPSDEAEALDRGFLILLPRLGVVKRVLEALHLKPNRELLPLLACFAPIDTHGAVSLYRQMFLSPVLLKQDPIFADNGYGVFLTGSEKLMPHVETLRAAFQLTDDEFVRIAAALGYDENTPLDVKNISAVFRRGWLARKLKLSIQEFLLLTRFTGIDPFAPPDPVDPPILRLIELVNRLRTVSLKPVQALYLIWNQDISGKSAPEDGEILGFARSLRSEFAAIESDFSLGLSDHLDEQVARARMALIYGNEATDLFFGILCKRIVTDVKYAQVQATLSQDILNIAPDSLAYDPLRKRLSYRAGVMPDAIRTALKSVAGVTDAFKNAVDELFQKTRTFFESYPELLPHYNAYLASNDPDEKKRADLLANLLPELKRRRKSQQALQAIAAAAKVDVGFAAAMLDNASIVHAADDPARPALHDLVAVDTAGLSAQFFFRDTATGTVDHASNAEADLTIIPASANTISGIWCGDLEAPQNGFYNFRIEADAGATVELTLDGKSVVVQNANSNVWSNQEPIELRAGMLYPISLKVEKVKDTLHVRWETSGRGWEKIPARYLYSATLTDQLHHVYVRFLKVASLAAALKMTAAEVAYFASHADYQIGGQGWLNSLPVLGDPNPAASTELFKVCTAMLEYARIKADLAPGDERLLAILKNPVTAALNPHGLLFTLTRWEVSSLNALLQHFNKSVADLAHLDTFRRVYDAYQWVKKLGIPASALIKAATNEPDGVIVRDLQAALRARYEEHDWLNVLKPINDEMRGLQRDALVAYILHQMRETPATSHIDTPEKLFEYFLMDVQMEPCMQTSRVRHALSSVQLFIERCLMNIEPRVDPSAINAKHWRSMSRYRVWEANRQVFCYPENWLEPELRLDQSPFLKETMSELLQSDITENSAATAMLNYLSKLKEVAKLEPCGIYQAEYDPTNAEDDIVHVVARTTGANRKYFYRRHEYGYWTPWEQIKLDIEDNPVIPVVWKGRVFIFWLRILQQPMLDPTHLDASPVPMDDKGHEKNFANLTLGDVKRNARQDASTNTRVQVQAILCWSEYYNGKWEPTKTSDLKKPTKLGEFDLSGDQAFDRSALRLSVSEVENKNALRVDIFGQGGSSFTLYNTHSLPLRQEDTGATSEFHPPRYMNTISDTLMITYVGHGILLHTGTWTGQLMERQVLKNQIPDSTVEPLHLLKKPWDAPFFYEDTRHVFYVSTTDRNVTLLEWDGYAPVPMPIRPHPVIPGMVLPDIKRPLAIEQSPVLKGPGFGVVDPSPIARFVSEDAYISRGIATLGTVRFGDQEIGPAGSVMNPIQ